MVSLSNDLVTAASSGECGKLVLLISKFLLILRVAAHPLVGTNLSFEVQFCPIEMILSSKRFDVKTFLHWVERHIGWTSNPRASTNDPVGLKLHSFHVQEVSNGGGGISALYMRRREHDSPYYSRGMEARKSGIMLFDSLAVIALGTSESLMRNISTSHFLFWV